MFRGNHLQDTSIQGKTSSRRGELSVCRVKLYMVSMRILTILRPV